MKKQSVLKSTLQEINFVERYRELSSRFSFELNERFEAFSVEEVVNILSGLGVKASYQKKESFFKIVNKIGILKFQFHISLKYGATELMWYVWQGEELIMGGPWGILKYLVDENYDEKIRLPIFRNYEDLKEIFTQVLAMYEDFKSNILILKFE